MNKKQVKDRILGCLVGAAYGDAMGALTETRTYDQIIDKFGGRVETFLKPSEDVFARGNLPGQVTDGFSMAYIGCSEIISHNGFVNDEVAKKALIEWVSYKDYYKKFVGPTTKYGIDDIKGLNTDGPETFIVAYDNLRATSGAAKKTAPFALFGGGDLDKTRTILQTMSKPTHFNNRSMAGVMAIAQSINLCLSHQASIDTVVESGVAGAIYGETKGQEIAGSSVSKKIDLAVSIAQTSLTLESCLRTLSDLVGTNSSIYDTVPTAYGIIAFLPQEPLEAIHAAVSIGNNTSTIATIVGGILGAYWGSDIFPSETISFLNKANDFNLEKLAAEIFENLGAVKCC